MTTDDQ